MSQPDLAAQQEAARNLIADLIKNSDIHNEDAAEERRLLGEEDQNADYEEHAEQLDQEEAGDQNEAGLADYDDVGEDGEYSDRSGVYKDQVQSAFENYGQITDQILAEWQEMFSLFDFDNTGFILTDDLGTVLRGLGRNLTEATIATFINSYDANGSGKLDFPTFYKLMCNESPMPGPCTEKQVMADFHVFDMYRDGLIPVRDLVHLLRNLGEPLTRDDVDHLLQEIYIDGDNKVNIKDLVQHMFRTSAPNPE